MRLDNLLKLDPFEGVEVVAGTERLDNEVSWVNLMEILDDLHQLQPGEFLISTGFGLWDDPSAAEAIVSELARRGIAGLALQTGYYIEAIPPSFVAAAKRHALPLMSLPKRLSFSRITKTLFDILGLAPRNPEERTLALRIRSSEGLTRPLMDNLLDDLLDRSVDTSYRNFYIRAESLGFRTDLSYRVGVLRLIPDPERPWNSEDLERLEGELLETLRGRPFPFVAMYWRRRPRHLTVLFHAPGEEKGPFLEALSHLCRVHREFDLLMGIGESKEDLDCIAESYEEAQVALDLSRHREFRSPVTSFRDVAVLHLLGGANDRGELQRFCSGTIRPLAEYDRANRSQLVLTLRTYLRDRNKNRTAQVLFIHRQTLAYRLRKIREITHRDLEDPDDLLALQLGLLADSLLSR